MGGQYEGKYLNCVLTPEYAALRKRCAKYYYVMRVDGRNRKMGKLFGLLPGGLVIAPVLFSVAAHAIYIEQSFGKLPQFQPITIASSPETLTEDIGFWESQTRYCVATNVSPFPGKENPDHPEMCDDQDMTLFNGLLCSVGDGRGCDAVKRAQGPDGRWWRSPRLVGVDRTHGGAAASMSEEQTWGVFLYLLQTKDKGAFQNWIRWIADESRPCWIKVGDSCLLFGLPQWCTDTTVLGACNFLPFECILFEHTATLSDANVEAVSGRIGCDLIMKATNAVFPNYTVQAQVQKQAIATSASSYYAIHKIGVQIYLLQKLGLVNDDLRDATNRILSHPESDGNAFLSYLKVGPSDEMANIILQECPDPKQTQRAFRYQWIWERAKSDPTRPNSSYWDCIFAAKLLTKSFNSHPQVVEAMQLAQGEAVRRDAYSSCSGMQLEARAISQSPPQGSTSDYQINFVDLSSTTPSNLWYRNNTFVAPCSGKYSAVVSARSVGPVALDLVSTFRYGQPLATLLTSSSDASVDKIFHLERYEAVSLVFRRNQASPTIAHAQLDIKWCKNQEDAGHCE
jgi:hypothetical protein